VIQDRDPGDITTIEEEGSVEEARQAWLEMREGIAAKSQVLIAAKATTVCPSHGRPFAIEQFATSLPKGVVTTAWHDA